MSKFEKNCKYPFLISCKAKMYGYRVCEIDLEDGTKLTYMPIPDEVRYCFASITRFYKSDEGQKLIEEELEKINKAIEK